MKRVTQALRSFADFWWDFIIGDDWRIAAGIVLAIGSTAALAAANLPAWRLLPASIPILLSGSLIIATRPHRATIPVCPLAAQRATDGLPQMDGRDGW